LPGIIAPAPDYDSLPFAANNAPVRVAENVKAAKLTSQPKLIYPPDAKSLTGIVGKVKNATVP